MRKNSILLCLGFMGGREVCAYFLMRKGGGVMKKILIYQLNIVLMSEALILLRFDSCVLKYFQIM